MMTAPTRLLLLTFGALTAPAIGAATEAEDVVLSYGTAVAGEDWLGAIRHFAPSDVGRIRAAFDAMLADDAIRSAFFGERTVAEIEQLSDEEFVAQLFGAVVTSSRQQGVTLTVDMPTLIGSVVETPELVHVVYRQEWSTNEQRISMVDMASAWLVGTGWHVKLPEEFETIIALLR